jgi:hypothetical protein
MSQQTQVEPVGVVCGSDGARRATLQDYLARRNIGEARWFAPGGLHDLDREVLRGRIRCVVFADLAALLEAIWEEEIAFRSWPGELRLEFAEPPGDGAVRVISESWQAWRERHRRRQAVAGAVLSAAVLGASFALCVLLGRWGR